MMRITNTNALKQTIANNRLESKFPSKKVKELLEKALTDSTITTYQIINLLRSS